MKSLVSYFRKHPYVLIMIVIAIIWMTINIIQGKQAQRDLETDGKYTLAIVKDIKGAKSGRWVKVEFEFDGRKYNAQAKNESIPQSWIGEKVFIKFLPSRPSEFDFYDKVNIPDSLMSLPPTVWDSLPNPTHSQ